MKWNSPQFTMARGGDSAPRRPFRPLNAAGDIAARFPYQSVIELI